MKFLLISGEILKNKSLTPTDKILVSYLYNLNKAGNSFFGSLDYLSTEFGIPVGTLEKSLKKLLDNNLIEKHVDGYKLSCTIELIATFVFEQKDYVNLNQVVAQVAQSFKGG
jgi:DNA-binding MarR family transcriptional regulator